MFQLLPNSCLVACPGTCLLELNSVCLATLRVQFAGPTVLEKPDKELKIQRITKIGRRPKTLREEEATV